MSEDSIPYGNDHKTFTLTELAESNMLTLEALFRVLEKKGLITKGELYDEIKLVQEEDRKARQAFIDRQKKNG